MYSWAILVSNVFCDWLFLVFSVVSLETAANFLLLFKVAKTLREKLCQLWRLNWFSNLKQKCWFPLLWGKRVSTKANRWWFQRRSPIPEATKIYSNNSTSVSPIYTFSMAGNKAVYTPIQGTFMKKYFNHTIYKGKMPTLARKKHLSFYLLLHRTRLFHLSTEKVTGLTRQKCTTKWLFPLRRNNY